MPLHSRAQRLFAQVYRQQHADKLSWQYLMVEITRNPIGAMLQSLLLAMHHHPELRAAYRAGPLTVWRNAYAQMGPGPRRAAR